MLKLRENLWITAEHYNGIPSAPDCEIKLAFRQESATFRQVICNRSICCLSPDLGDVSKCSSSIRFGLWVFPHYSREEPDNGSAKPERYDVPLCMCSAGLFISSCTITVFPVIRNIIFSWRAPFGFSAESLHLKYGKTKGRYVACFAATCGIR